MSEILLSIAMPSYNVEKYLRRGLDSLAQKDFVGKLEVLIVNDGSTDGTANIAQEYVDRMPEVFCLVNKANGGHGSAVNAGICQARGKYFRVVDGDDWVNPEGLLQVLSALSATDADIVVDERCDVDMKTESAHVRLLPSAFEKLGNVSFDNICDNPDCEDYFTIHTMNIKTSLLKDNHVQLHEGIFYVDLQYCVLATAFCNKVEFVPVQVYDYLVGNANQSVSYSNYVKRYDDHAVMVKDVVTFCDSASASSEFSEKRKTYLETRAIFALNTHYNIALIYDKDRTRGAKRAAEFKAWLAQNYPRFDELTEGRYKKTKLLHDLGFDGPKLNKLMSGALFKSRHRR